MCVGENHTNPLTVLFNLSRVLAEEILLPGALLSLVILIGIP